MNLTLVAVVTGLVFVGTYLVTSRSLTRIVLGFALIGHATVVGLLTAGGPRGVPPLVDQIGDEPVANPLPQALALTAIVISFGLTLFLLALARRENELTGDDLVEDDLEDRRVAETSSEDDGDDWVGEPEERYHADEGPQDGEISHEIEHASGANPATDRPAPAETPAPRQPNRTPARLQTDPSAQEVSR
jgi:multicomponent Na+:H+ antiporter subunit C